MFELTKQHDVWPIALLKKAMLATVALLLMIGAVSSHRAYIQVRDLQLTVTDSDIRAGSSIDTHLVSSGRTTITVRLELIQGIHSETLNVLVLRGSESGFFDPRPRTGTQHVV